MKHLAYKTRFVVSPKKSFCWNPLAHIWHFGRGPAFEMAFVLKRQWQLYFTKCCFGGFFPLDTWILYFAWILYFIRLDLSGFTPSVESVPSSHHSWTSWPITCHLSTLLIVPLQDNLQAPWQLSTLILQRGVVGGWIICVATESRWELWLHSDHKHFQFLIAVERFKNSWRLWLQAGRAESSVSLFRILNVLSLSRIPNSEKGRWRGGIKERKADFFFFWTSAIQLWSSLSSRSVTHSMWRGDPHPGAPVFSSRSCCVGTLQKMSTRNSSAVKRDN